MYMSTSRQVADNVETDNGRGRATVTGYGAGGPAGGGGYKRRGENETASCIH